MIKEVKEIYKLAFVSDSFIKSFVDALFPRNYQKEIAENTEKMVKTLDSLGK